MSIIEVDRLSKTYQVYQRPAGLAAAAKSLFRRRYQPVHAVREVSFRIEEGEIVGFLGPNGAGKTTTLKMLSGLVFPASGSARVMGFVPWERDDAYRRQFSLVMGQKNQLWWDLPASESFVLNRDIYDIGRADFQHTRDELVDLLDVREKLGVPVRELSLGERMKLELVAALLHRPRVLFLDEPTIGLDVIAQANIRRALAEYNRTSRITTILTSHYMNDIEALCERVIIINHGRLNYDGPLSGVVEKFSRHKLLRVRFRDGTEVPTFGPAARVIEHRPPTVLLEVDRDDVTRVAGEILDHETVEDIGIEEIPIEDVFAEVFGQTDGDDESATCE